MNSAELLQLALGLAVFVATLVIGRRKPRIPLIAFAWTAPYLGGNFIGPFEAPFAPAHAIGFGIVALVVIYTGPAPESAKRLRQSVYALLGICIAAACIGVCVVYLRAQFIDSWRQTPPVRALRATGGEALRWLLLIAPAVLASRRRLSRDLIKHAIFAGLFYCALGFVQLGMEQGMGYDPFPIMRENAAGQGYNSQTAMGTGLDGRINSICGEPRYLSAYCCLWFLLSAALGKRLGLTWGLRLSASAVFLLTAFMTGSRTGLMTLAVTGFVGSAMAIVTKRSRLAVSVLTATTLLGGVAAILVTMQIGSFGSRNNSANVEESVTVGQLRVPIEWQDIAGLSVMVQNPWCIALGMGPGLWQYYENPWEHEHVRRYTPGLGGSGLDSVKPNFQVMNRLSDLGLTGLYAVVAILALLYRHGRARTPIDLRAEFAVTFAMLVAMLQLSSMADQLVCLMAGAAVEAYRDLASSGVNRQVRPSARNIREISPQLQVRVS